MKRRLLLGAAIALVPLCIGGVFFFKLSGPGRALAGAGQTFQSNGVKIWYEVRGEVQSTPLVVINGGPGFDHAYLKVSDVWDRLAERRPTPAG